MSRLILRLGEGEEDPELLLLLLGVRGQVSRDMKVGEPSACMCLLLGERIYSLADTA